MAEQAFHLVVKVPFHDFDIGDRIEDPALIAKILGGEHAHLEKHCIKIAAPVAPPAADKGK